MTSSLTTTPVPSHVINIPETLRAVGVYAVVDDAILFVPSELIDELVERDPSRVGGDESYCDFRMSVYRACVMARYVLLRSGTERHRDLPERLVRLGSVGAAVTHRDRLSRHYRRCGLPNGLPPSSIFDETRARASMTALEGLPPSAVGLVPGAPIFGDAAMTYDVARDDGTSVRVRTIEILPGVGSYVWVDDRGYFAPTRLLGELRRAPNVNASPSEQAAATLAVFARLPRLYEEREPGQAGLPFFRRMARFRAQDDAVTHRTRLAAMFLLPASPSLTRPEEAGFHYGAAVDCDRSWMERYSQEDATATSS